MHYHSTELVSHGILLEKPGVIKRKLALGVQNTQGRIASPCGNMTLSELLNLSESQFPRLLNKTYCQDELNNESKILFKILILVLSFPRSFRKVTLNVSLICNVRHPGECRIKECACGDIPQRGSLSFLPLVCSLPSYVGLSPPLH